MNPPISIHEAAEAELNEAAEFYDLKSPNLGSVFIDEVEKGIEIISKHPEAPPLVRGRLRKKGADQIPVFACLFPSA
jgi:hypothetical protein